ncbi:MAG: endonuclease domain-containing protein [Candidatus Margulisiibacteriota bacterium]
MKEAKKQFARMLRKEQTKSEKTVWELIRNRKFGGFKFRRQHVVEGFILDFYCHELRIGIEVDGSVHLKQKDYDELRQEIIESEGINIIRITNRDIMERTNKAILKKIEKMINRSANPSPSGLPAGRQGEGHKEKDLVKRKIRMRVK